MSDLPVRIVMVETSHPGNIGAAARAMKNMGLTRLHLVNPRLFPHADATSRASGADDVLASARVHDSLGAALAGCSVVFGASARRRSIAWPEVDARECGRRCATADGEVAIVVGREHAGLTNDELEHCHYLVHIPTAPDYSSLNAAAAVQVLAYEVFMAAGEAPSPGRERREDGPASADELAGLYDHLERTLVAIDFLDPDNPRQVMRRLRRLFNRAHPLRTEVNILRGVLSAATRQATLAREAEDGGIIEPPGRDSAD